MKDELNEPNQIRVGEGSKCTLCVYGKIVISKAIHDPVRVAMERAADPTFKPGPTIQMHDSLCTHPIITGGSFMSMKGWFRKSESRGVGPAKSMGIVVSCELFEARKL